MLRTTKVFVIASALFGGCMDSGIGAINLDTKLDIDFQNATDAQAKATWSPADRIGITANGLGWNVHDESATTPWVETKPIAFGLSWRAATAAGITVKISVWPRDIQREDSSYPSVGNVYVRYSPDAKNWSMWQALQQKEKDKTSGPEQETIFECTLRVPQRDREEYSNLVSEYSTLDVPWNDDEEAAVKWIIAKQPDYFTRHLPFVGYVEFLYEFNSFDKVARLTMFRAELCLLMPGTHTSPKDPNAEKNRDGPWRYKAE